LETFFSKKTSQRLDLAALILQKIEEKKEGQIRNSEGKSAVLNKREERECSILI
jgi:hypothetical protein